ncbi:MAG: YveK family protein [Coprococcus sp.]
MENEDTIDLLALFKLFLQKWYIIAGSALILGGIFLGYTYFGITPQYEGYAVFYVNTTKISLSDGKVDIGKMDLTMAKSLVNTYKAILNTPDTYREILDDAGMSDLPYEYLNNKISAEAVGDTEIFKVSVTGSDKKEIKNITDSIIRVLPLRIAEIVDGSDVRIVNNTIIEPGRISPSYTKNTLIGLFIGAFLAVFIIFLKDISNNAVRNDDYLTETYDIPILTVVPNFNHKTNYGRYYRRNMHYKNDEGDIKNGKKVSKS